MHMPFHYSDDSNQRNTIPAAPRISRDRKGEDGGGGQQMRMFCSQVATIKYLDNKLIRPRQRLWNLIK